jgi:hypothetical protein
LLATFPTQEIMTMAEPAEEAPPASQKRVQPFLDCVAYQLAKRWLRDQQQENSPQKKSGDHADQHES